jgi:phosphoenolpyruvate carboxylase
VTAVNLVLWVAGIALIVVGFQRARGPWARYQELKEQEANVARYEAWRGGIRDGNPTAASVAMALLRRQWQMGAGVAVVGVVLVLLGFAVR